MLKTGKYLLILYMVFCCLASSAQASWFPWVSDWIFENNNPFEGKVFVKETSKSKTFIGLEIYVFESATAYKHLRTYVDVYHDSLASGEEGRYMVNKWKNQLSLESSEKSEDYKYSIEGRVLHLSDVTSSDVYYEIQNLDIFNGKITIDKLNTIDRLITEGAQTSRSNRATATAQNSASSVSSPTPKPTTVEPVTSSNPVTYSGSYIDQVSGQQGHLTLSIEHFINTEDGKLAFGATIILENSSRMKVSGVYDPTFSQITFSEGTQATDKWVGTLSGNQVSGNFENQKSHQQQGIWLASHTGGLSFEQAWKAYGGNAVVLQPQIPQQGQSTSLVQNLPVAQSTPIVPITQSPSAVASVAGEYVGDTLNEATGKRHQIRLILEFQGTENTNLKAKIIDLKNSNSYTGIGTVDYEKEALVSLNFDDKMRLSGTVSNSVYQGKWWATSDRNEAFTGIFQLEKAKNP